MEVRTCSFEAQRSLEETNQLKQNQILFDWKFMETKWNNKMLEFVCWNFNFEINWIFLIEASWSDEKVKHEI